MGNDGPAPSSAPPPHRTPASESPQPAPTSAWPSAGPVPSKASRNPCQGAERGRLLPMPVPRVAPPPTPLGAEAKPPSSFSSSSSPPLGPPRVAAASAALSSPGGSSCARPCHLLHLHRRHKMAAAEPEAGTKPWAPPPGTRMQADRAHHES